MKARKNEEGEKMRITEYQDKSKRTLNPKLSKHDQLANMLMGIQGETGEVADHFKKHFYQGHNLDMEKVAEEIGDVMFYIANLCNLSGLDLGQILESNHQKLLKRYPEGFEKEKSVNRSE